MLTAAIIITCFLGTSLTLRVSMLTMKDKYERRLAAGRYPYPDWEDYVFAVIGMTIFWPVTLLALAAWKLAFPRGIKTRYAKEQQLQAALRKAQKDADEQDRRIKELEKEILAWTPGPYDRERKS